MEQNKLSLLQTWLKKEIDAMREILANMHLEELSLLNQDLDEWSRILQQRSYLYLTLHDVREKRIAAVSAAFPQLNQDSEYLPQLNNPTADNCEILLLTDQITSLIEKLKSQSSRNQLLSQIANKSEFLQNSTHENKKKKLKIATMPPEEIS